MTLEEMEKALIHEEAVAWCDVTRMQESAPDEAQASVEVARSSMLPRPCCAVRSPCSTGRPSSPECAVDAGALAKRVG